MDLSMMFVVDWTLVNWKIANTMKTRQCATFAKEIIRRNHELNLNIRSMSVTHASAPCKNVGKIVAIKALHHARSW